MNTTTGALTPRSSGLSGAATSPAHFAVLKSGAEIVAANYGGGSIASLVLLSDRTLLPASYSKLIKFMGSGPNSARQASPHPHQVYEYIDNQELLVPDLGSDRIWRIKRSTKGVWELGGSITAVPGSGPRHVQVHGGYLYTVNELTNMISQHTLPPLASGEASQLVANLSTIPANTAGSPSVAEILLSPLNDMYPTRYLYVTNRGDADPAGDTIAIFSVNPLALVTHVRTGLKGIRGATIGGVNGEYLAAAGQNGGGVVVYRRVDGGSGLSQLARYSGNDVKSPSTLVIVPDQASAGITITNTAYTREPTLGVVTISWKWKASDPNTADFYWVNQDSGKWVLAASGAQIKPSPGDNATTLKISISVDATIKPGPYKVKITREGNQSQVLGTSGGFTVKPEDFYNGSFKVTATSYVKSTRKATVTWQYYAYSYDKVGLYWLNTSTNKRTLALASVNAKKAGVTEGTKAATVTAPASLPHGPYRLELFPPGSPNQLFARSSQFTV